MTIEEMKERKRQLGYSNETIASLSGVPLGTVMKIFSGATKAPRQKSLEALEKVLAPEGKAIYNAASLIEGSSSSVRETPIAWAAHTSKKPNHRYTIDDYMNLPQDVRTELIDGVFYDMAAPSIVHQTILGELHLQLRQCADTHAGKCKVVLSPCDVQLDRDRYTMVQPDILVLCLHEDDDRLHVERILGAPDLVIEIMSPSSRSIDAVLKLNKYKNAHVREYWIVDPENEKVIVYDIENGQTFSCFTFQDQVPVHISDKKCSIDFTIVRAALDFIR